MLLIPTSINLSVWKFVILWKKLTIFKILQSLTFLHPGLHFTEPKVCLTESYAAGCLLNYTPRNFSNYVQHERVIRVIMQIRYPFFHQDPVVWSPISANLWLHFNPGFFIPSFKSLLGIIFYIAFRVSSHHILDKKNSIEFFFKAFRSVIKLIMGYLNPILNNLAQ